MYLIFENYDHFLDHFLSVDEKYRYIHLKFIKVDNNLLVFKDKNGFEWFSDFRYVPSYDLTEGNCYVLKMETTGFNTYDCVKIEYDTTLGYKIDNN